MQHTENPIYKVAPLYQAIPKLLDEIIEFEGDVFGVSNSFGNDKHEDGEAMLEDDEPQEFSGEEGDIAVAGTKFVDTGTNGDKFEIFVSDDNDDICVSDNGTTIIVVDETFCCLCWSSNTLLETFSRSIISSSFVETGFA